MFKSGEHVHPTLPNAMFIRERERGRVICIEQKKRGTEREDKEER